MKFKKDPQRNKKKKNKQPDKKPRSVAHAFVLDINNIPPDTEYIPLEWHHNITTGETHSVINGNKILADGLVMSYDRPGKTAKQVLRMEDTGTTNKFSELVKKFDLLVAIDTNTATIGGTTHHVSFGCQAVFNSEKKISNIVALPQNFVLLGDYDKPENRNIRSLIEFIKSTTFSRPGVKFEDMYIGIITDSDLINHSAINKRKIPLIENYFLPQNIELIFATDAASDTIFNQMIRWCHKYSTDMIKEAKPKLERQMNK